MGGGFLCRALSADRYGEKQGDKNYGVFHFKVKFSGAAINRARWLVVRLKRNF